MTAYLRYFAKIIGFNKNALKSTRPLIEIQFQVKIISGEDARGVRDT